ncbi:MAG: cytochrome c3 family protein [Calditrichia bacterium]
MNHTGTEKLPPGRKKSRFWAVLLITAAGWLVLLAAFLFFQFYYESKIGPEQPVPFSHRVHANKKQISCVMCHQEVTRSAVAGIPPLETCMLCHSRIIIHHPEIENVRQHYFQRVPIIWEKVTFLPDFVYFNHSVHIQRGIDCGHCHGNIKEMDRVMQVQKFEMGFCIQCHRDNNATTDCFTCHR